MAAAAPFSPSSVNDLQALIDLSPALISFFDADHICRYANAHHLHWYGRRPEDLVGLHMRDFLGEDAYTSRKPHLDLIAQGTPAAFDALVPHVAGGWRDAAVRYIPRTDDAGVRGFYVLVFDVAQRKRELAEMLDLAHDAILVRRLDGVVTYWNRASEALYGTAARDAEGRRLEQLLRIDMAAEAAAEARLLQEGHWEGELQRVTPDGAARVIALRWSLRRGEDGAPRDILEFGGDVTAARQAEADLARAKNDLAHAARVASLGEMTASIAHEINQPLTAVITNGMGATRWLKRAEPEIDEALAAIERSVREARRAAEVVTRVRALARRGEPETNPVSVRDLIDETAVLLRRELAEHDVTFVARAAPELPRVQVDAVQIQQVLLNLVLNAIQAMEAAGSTRRELSIAASRREGAVEVEIADSGPGFAPEVAERLFEAFVTTKADGLGLGLSISRTIIDQHGGALTAANGESGGAVFRFTLPVAP